MGRRERTAPTLLVLAILAILAGMAGCSGGTAGDPAREGMEINRGMGPGVSSSPTTVMPIETPPAQTASPFPGTLIVTMASGGDASQVVARHDFILGYRNLEGNLVMMYVDQAVATDESALAGLKDDDDVELAEINYEYPTASGGSPQGQDGQLDTGGLLPEATVNVMGDSGGGGESVGTPAE